MFVDRDMVNDQLRRYSRVILHIRLAFSMNWRSLNFFHRPTRHTQNVNEIRRVDADADVVHAMTIDDTI